MEYRTRILNLFTTMPAAVPFKAQLRKTLLSSLFNHYNDNVDAYRFGKNAAEAEKNKSKIRKVLSHIKSDIKLLKTFSRENYETISYFEYLYNLLEDDYSKALLVKVCAYRILGHRKVKLPMNNSTYWKTVASIENTIANKSDFLYSSHQKWKLFKYNLKSLGYSIDLYMRPAGIYYTFAYKCYNFNNDGTFIGVQKGNHVIDAGACFGDTALFFAHQAGKEGKVYSFEFVPENVKILTQNLHLNPELSNRIKIIENPLWSKSEIPIYFDSNGPATQVSMERISPLSAMVLTKTIDDLVAEGTIEKVDFIKMDIEGAEIEALKGSENTLRKFKPCLAICLYHSPADFKIIPEYIKSLHLGYKFYFNHYTMHKEESVLFCTIE